MDAESPVITTAEVVEEFLKDCDLRELADKTIEFYRWSLDKLVAQCPTWPASVDQVAAAWDSPTLGPVSRRDVERGLRIFFRSAEKKFGYPNPLGDTKSMPKAKTKPRVLQEEEVAAVWAACITATEKALIALLLDTGLRLGELAGLRWADVQTKTLTVDGKTGPRSVPVSAPVRRMLDGLGDSTRIWVSRNGPMSRAAVQSAVRRVFQRSGLEGSKLGPHLLRHSFATFFAEDEGSLPHLQRILGHQSIKTTEVYIHLSMKSVSASHAAHSPGPRFLAEWQRAQIQP